VKNTAVVRLSDQTRATTHAMQRWRAALSGSQATTVRADRPSIPLASTPEPTKGDVAMMPIGN